jgi:hypothetical protein
VCLRVKLPENRSRIQKWKVKKQKNNIMTVPLSPEDIEVTWWRKFRMPHEEITPAASLSWLHYSHWSSGGNAGNIRYKRDVLGNNVWLSIDFCKSMYVCVPLYEQFIRYSHHVWNIKTEKIKMWAYMELVCSYPASILMYVANSKPSHGKVMLFCLQISHTHTHTHTFVICIFQFFVIRPEIASISDVIAVINISLKTRYGKGTERSWCMGDIRQGINHHITDWPMVQIYFTTPGLQNINVYLIQ